MGWKKQSGKDDKKREYRILMANLSCDLLRRKWKLIILDEHSHSHYHAQKPANTHEKGKKQKKWTNVNEWQNAVEITTKITVDSHCLTK